MIVLLISSAFIASNYIYATELDIALKRHEDGTARVVPVLVRACDWHTQPFAALQVLPDRAKPVKLWADPDVAWTRVARGLREAIAVLPRV